MKKTKIKIFVILSLGLLCGGLLHAQTSVNAAGGDASGPGGSAAYSIGIVSYTTQGSSGTVEQGVQHAYDVTTSGVEKNSIDFFASVFPNPTVDVLVLKIAESSEKNLNYQLYNVQGKLLRKDRIQEQETTISMQNLAKGIYFLHVRNENQLKIQTFKIVKK